MSIRLDVPPTLEVLSRHIVVFRVIDELAKSVGADEVALNTIKKGVLERQILAKIVFVYLSKSKLVGKLTLTIDWETHRVLAETEQDRFELNPKTSIAKQISGIFPVLTEHVTQLRKKYEVDEVRSLYYCRPEIDQDTNKRNEAWKFLGLSATKMPDWPAKHKTDVNLEFSPKELKELGIQIEHGK